MLILMLIWLAATLAAWQLYRRGLLRHDLHNDLLALGALGLATAGFFWRLLFSADVWMPVGGGDLASFLYPVYSFAARSLRAGDLPLWNPYLYGGAPFAADNQSGLFYPINLVAFLLRPQLDYRTMELLAVAHFYLAGVCAYFGLRYISKKALKRWAALAGAAAFMFSDLFVTHFGNLNMIACAAWLPLIFCLFRRALEEERVILAAAAGVVLGIAALAGHVQPLLYIVLTLALYLMYHIYTHRRDDLRPLLRSAGLLALTLILALGVAAPALLPSFEMSRLTLRADLPYVEASQYSLPPAALIGLFVPGIFGRGPGGFWGSWPRVEVGYAGILTLLLAALAPVLRRDKLTSFFALLCVLSVFLALGSFTILHSWLYRFVPGFDMIRAPARFIYLLDFSLAALAALGLDAILRPIPPRRRRQWQRALRLSALAMVILVPVILVVAYAALLGSQDSSEVFARMLNATHGVVFALLLLGCGVVLLHLRARRRVAALTLGIAAFSLIVVDLASLGAYTELEPSDPLGNFEHPAAIAFLKSDPEYYRIDTRTEVWDVWPPDLSLLHGIYDVWGIHNPLVLAEYHRYWEGLGSRSTALYDFLNAKYVIGHKDVVLDWDKFELACDADPSVNIYRNTRVLPRAFVVHEAWSVPDQEHAFAAIHESNFDPATMVVVEKAQPLHPETTGTSEAQIVSYSRNEIRVHVSTSASGYLVMSEVYYPGWQVDVDGQHTNLVRANYAFRAVALSPGEHEVRFRFEPSSWRAGLAFSAVTWLALCCTGLRALAGRRRLRAAR